jgi:hypothetical protein
LSRRSRYLAGIALVLLTALAITTNLRYKGKAPVKLPASACNAELWKHIAESERLKVLEPCTAVDGRIVSMHENRDGDLHIALAPDQKSVLNVINAMHANSHLVVEVICEHTPLENDARASCAGFTSTIAIPEAGEHVRVTGAYVTDSDNGWNEIHPVTRIEILH